MPNGGPSGPMSRDTAILSLRYPFSMKNIAAGPLRMGVCDRAIRVDGTFWRVR